MADQHNDFGEGRCMTGEQMGLVADVNKWNTTVWRRSVATPPISDDQPVVGNQETKETST